jgi:ATP-dependent RNA helicase DDX1
VPETVHHCVLRVDLERHGHQFASGRGHPKLPPVVLDGVHVGSHLTEDDRKSLRLKELKQRILIKIIDKFEVFPLPSPSLPCPHPFPLCHFLLSCLRGVAWPLQMSQCIIFCRTNLDCNNLETFLCSQDGGSSGGSGGKFRGKMESGKEIKYSCAVLAGMRSLQDRRESLSAFRDGNIRFLIATDVAARGLDITGLPFIINMTLPEECENYIHRIGRVGRADRMGLALSIVSPEEVSERVWFHTCSNKGKDGNCTRRHLVSDGGCTILYNETEKLRAIEKRLDMSVPELNPDDYSLPEELASLGVEYGELCPEDEGALEKQRAKFHFDELEPAMRELCEMEYQTQNIFLSLQHGFAH